MNRELTAYHVWMKRHGKRPTSSGFVYRLLRAEPELPARVRPNGNNGATKQQPEGWDEWRDEKYPEARVTVFWRVSDDVRREFRESEKLLSTETYLGTKTA